MTGGFQQQVYPQPAQAVAGDFASLNQWYSYDAGPGGLIAGSGGVVVGRFAWTVPPVDVNGTNQVANSFGAGPVAGFVHRAQQGLNPTYLSNAGMTIQPGFGLALMTGGDFWVVNDGATQALPGQKAYADLLTGKVSFAATGTPTNSASATASSIAAATNGFTGSIANNLLTVTAVSSGTIYPGTTIAGAGVASGTKIVSQVSGTPGGIGVYLLSIPEQTVASEAMTGSYGILTIGTATGVFSVGNQLNATGAVVAGTKITANITGSGGTGGTMVVDNNTVVSSQTISAAGNVETKWIAMSSGLPGELVKMSSHPNG